MNENFVGKGVLINGECAKIFQKLDDNHYSVELGSSKIVLSSEQIEKATQRNLILKPGTKNYVLRNWFFQKKVKESLVRNKIGVVEDYFVVNMQWGEEDYESVGIFLGFNKNRRGLIFVWMREWLLSIPSNLSAVEYVEFLRTTKFPKEITKISVALTFYPGKWSAEINCVEGFSIKIIEKLVEVN
jgi:hypothetical protein